MKKIPSLYIRNYGGDHLVRDEITPGCEWIFLEGRPTRKWDGTACLIRGGKLFKRYDAKRGKIPPDNFESCQEPDPITGHWPGWIPVGDGPEDKWLREAFVPNLEDGTYECCGPKIQGNPEGFGKHVLLRHGAETLKNVPNTFNGLREYLATADIEGIVFHAEDGRMAKIKAKDFGLGRRAKD